MELFSLSPDGSQTPTCKSSERGIRQAGGTMDLWHTLNCKQRRIRTGTTYGETDTLPAMHNLVPPMLIHFVTFYVFSLLERYS